MTTTKLPQITLKPCVSKQLHAYGWCPNTNTLDIQFKGKNGPGSTYRYSNVSAEDYAALEAAESKGKHFGQHIKPHKEKYPFSKLEEE
jgi:hypothetical protein